MKSSEKNIIADKERYEAVRTLEQWAIQQGKQRTLLIITSERQGKDLDLLAVNKAVQGQALQLIGSIISMCADDKSGDLIKIFRKGVECAQQVIDGKFNISPDSDDKSDSTMAQA